MLVDWRLPGIDGDELARMVHERYGEQRPLIILITAYGRELMAHPLNESHIDGLLIKPLTPSAVNDAIMEAYGIRQPSAFELDNRPQQETRLKGRVPPLSG